MRFMKIIKLINTMFSKEKKQHTEDQSQKPIPRPHPSKDRHNEIIKGTTSESREFEEQLRKKYGQRFFDKFGVTKRGKKSLEKLIRDDSAGFDCGTPMLLDLMKLHQLYEISSTLRDNEKGD